MGLSLSVAVTITVSVIGSSIATYLTSNRTVSRVAEESNRTIREITNDFSHKSDAMSYAQQAASSESRKLNMEDLKEGLDLADKALEKFKGVNEAS